jgi:hypothetical protein
VKPRRPKGGSRSTTCSPRRAAGSSVWILAPGYHRAAPLEAAFDAGRLTSDGGLPWLAEADEALGLCEALARCIPEPTPPPVAAGDEAPDRADGPTG